MLASLSARLIATFTGGALKVKRVTSSDDGTVEDPEENNENENQNENGSQSGSQNGSSTGDRDKGYGSRGSGGRC